MEIEKVEKLAANLDDVIKYGMHITHLKQALNHGSVLKKVHKVIKFNENGWLKPYIDMNTDLRKKVKNDFEKKFLKLTVVKIKKQKALKYVSKKFKFKNYKNCLEEP